MGLRAPLVCNAAVPPDSTYLLCDDVGQIKRGPNNLMKWWISPPSVEEGDTVSHPIFSVACKLGRATD